LLISQYATNVRDLLKGAVTLVFSTLIWRLIILRKRFLLNLLPVLGVEGLGLTIAEVVGNQD